jgi:hypothetical protein
VAFGMLDGFWVALYDPEGVEKTDDDHDDDNDIHHNKNSIVKKEEDIVIDKKIDFDVNLGNWLLVIKPVHANLSVILKIKDIYRSPSVNDRTVVENSLEQSKPPHLSNLFHLTSLTFNIRLFVRMVDVSVQRSHLVLIRDAAVGAIQFMKEQQKKVFKMIITLFMV